MDDPRRFLHSQSGGAYLGLTPGDTNLARLIGWTDHSKRLAGTLIGAGLTFCGIATA
ncbi:hypothetical protein [Bradyrhizobium sp. WSM4349]|uniref:hypothetical protein n=1 Tax=Bradyrhizobium sp. WSM4349 TaxID=1040988 RepID=UPI001FD88530|nr:hypothetical protein [Bradyrhizobium sp. WSM4349]